MDNNSDYSEEDNNDKSDDDSYDYSENDTSETSEDSGDDNFVSSEEDDKPKKKKPKLKISKKKKRLKIPKPEVSKEKPKDIIELFNNASDEKVVFKWTENELKEILLDYVRFIVLKAAFPDIENNAGTYSNLLKNYKLFNTEINSMSNFMITHLDFPEDLVGAVRRHSQRNPYFRYVNESCMVCQIKPSHKIQYLGPNYNKNDLKIEKTTFPPQCILLCHIHTYLSDTFFSLIHMKWNIHLNIEHRLKQLNIICRGNKTIIDDIGNDVITNLAAYYFHIICRLKSADPVLLNLYVPVQPVAFREALRSLEIKTIHQKVLKK